MSKLFESHLIDIRKQEITSINRQPTNKMVTVASDIPCRISGTVYSSTNRQSYVKLYVLASNYELIPGGLHQNYEIIVKGDFVQKYVISKEPMWGGGQKHHVECLLEEAK